MSYAPEQLWQFIGEGYLFSIAIETPLLILLLSRPHPLWRRFFCGLWLTAVSYPIVILVLPLVMPNHTSYLIVAETFAPLSEIAVFGLAFWNASIMPKQKLQDFIAIIVANLASFVLGVFF